MGIMEYKGIGFVVAGIIRRDTKNTRYSEGIPFPFYFSFSFFPTPEKGTGWGFGEETVPGLNPDRRWPWQWNCRPDRVPARCYSGG